MSGTKITTLKVRAKTFDVYVTSGGYFQADTKGANIGYIGHHKSLEELRAALMDATKKAKVKLGIAAVRLDGVKAYDVTILSKHAGRDRLIVRDNVSGAREEVETYATFYRPLTAEERAEYTRLASECRRATKAYAEFKESKQLNVRKIIAEREAEAAKQTDEATAEPDAVESCECMDKHTDGNGTCTVCGGRVS
jgi:hypothetical protein